MHRQSWEICGPGYSEPAGPRCLSLNRTLRSPDCVRCFYTPALRRSILVRAGSKPAKWDLGLMMRRGTAGGYRCCVICRRARAPWPGSRRPENARLFSALRCGIRVAPWCATRWPFVVSRWLTTSLIATGCRSARRPHPRSGFPTPFCCALVVCPGPVVVAADCLHDSDPLLDGGGGRGSARDAVGHLTERLR